MGSEDGQELFGIFDDQHGRILMAVRYGMAMKALIDAVAKAEGMTEVEVALNAVLVEAQRLEDENKTLWRRVKELEAIG
jgi:methylaspartate ammonia-lyase